MLARGSAVAAVRRGLALPWGRGAKPLQVPPQPCVAARRVSGSLLAHGVSPLLGSGGFAWPCGAATFAR